ncbi:MAG: hypothetical protein WBM02_00240 [bacterium]
MRDWLKSFLTICKEMNSNGETKRYLPDRGKIVWLPNLKCPHCLYEGTFYGDDLEYGAFYECASARYCPSCHKIYDAIEGRNFAIYDSEKFLPIMKKKLMAAPQTFENFYLISGTEFRPGGTTLTKEEKNCPRCGGDTYTFHKDLGAIDYHDNYWTICTNPICDWPGKHRAIYERGPY